MTTATIRRSVGLSVLALALALLPGCIKQKTTAKIDASGKGTVKIDIRLDLAKLKQLKEQMGAMMGGGAEGSEDEKNPLDDTSPEKVKKLLEGNEHVRVVSVSSKKDEATMSNTIEVEFDSLKDLFESGLVQGMDVKLEKLDDGNYRFMQGYVNEHEGMGGSSAEDEQQMQFMMQMFEPFLGDLELATTLTLPTDIVETNGSKTDSRTVEWKLGFKDLVKAEKRKQTVTFSGEGLSWKPFAVTAASEKAAQEKHKEGADDEGDGDSDSDGDK